MVSFLGCKQHLPSTFGVWFLRVHDWWQCGGLSKEHFYMGSLLTVKLYFGIWHRDMSRGAKMTLNLNEPHHKARNTHDVALHLNSNTI